MSVDIEQIRANIRQGNLTVSPHALIEAKKDGISPKTAQLLEEVALYGEIIEDYPERHRYLIYHEVVIERYKIPVHVVLEYEFVEEPAIVTAYVPDNQWIASRKRAKRRKGKGRK